MYQLWPKFMAPYKKSIFLKKYRQNLNFINIFAFKF